jgi:hypothetical protein
MNEITPFDATYVKSDFSTSLPTKKSDTKQFLKQPISPDDLARYGNSKPVRIRIRAKLIHD